MSTPETCQPANNSRTDAADKANVASVVTDAEIKAFRDKYREFWPGSHPDRQTIIELLTASKQAVSDASEAFCDTLSAALVWKEKR